MKKITKLILPAIFVASLASGQALVDYQFNDADGNDVNDPLEVINAGSENDAAWNFGVGRVQNGNLNYAYTSFYKFTTVDTNPGTAAFRTLAFSDDLTTADMTAYSLTIDFAQWDLRQNWDSSNDSASDKGIQIALVGDGGDATVAFTTSGVAGFRAFSQGGDSSFTQAFGNSFDNALSRFSATGGLLQINGDLSTGLWSARANDGLGGAWQTLGNGTGMTTVSAITIASRSPTAGSWGGASAGEAVDATLGGTAGDFLMIDSLVLTNIPEPDTYALIAGALALTAVMVRRRK